MFEDDLFSMPEEEPQPEENEEPEEQQPAKISTPTHKPISLDDYEYEDDGTVVDVDDEDEEF